MSYHATHFERNRPDRTSQRRGLVGQRQGRRTYGHAAFVAAVENGLMPEELGQLLAGRNVVEAFPVSGNESVADYAYRTVAEMMVAYVAQGIA